MLIQANIDAPCILLDYPTIDRFEGELKTTRYEIVGISAIPPNLKSKRLISMGNSVSITVMLISEISKKLSICFALFGGTMK